MGSVAIPSGGNKEPITLSGEMFNPYSALVLITYPSKNKIICKYSNSYSDDEFIYTYVKNSTSTIKSTNGGTYLITFYNRDTTSGTISKVTVGAGGTLLSLTAGVQYHYTIVKL